MVFAVLPPGAGAGVLPAVPRAGAAGAPAGPDAGASSRAAVLPKPHWARFYWWDAISGAAARECCCSDAHDEFCFVFGTARVVLWTAFEFCARDEFYCPSEFYYPSSFRCPSPL